MWERYAWMHFVINTVTEMQGLREKFYQGVVKPTPGPLIFLGPRQKSLFVS